MDRAKEVFEHVVTLAPSFSNARWYLASVYEQQSNLQGAIEQVERVLALDPTNEIIKNRLDRLYKGQLKQETILPLEEGDGPDIGENLPQ